MTTTALYRLFAEDGALLYVGISARPWTRFIEHREKKLWWTAVVRVEMGWHPTRESAHAAEVEVIRTEMPRHNVQHAAPSAEALEAIDALVQLREQLAAVKAEYREALTELVSPTGGAVPVAYMAEQLGLTRKTVYRHVGRTMA